MFLAKNIRASTFPAFRSRTALGRYSGNQRRTPCPSEKPLKERPMRKLIFCLCCLLWAIPACADDLELDLECLQEAYPGFITGTETDDAGHVWFLTKNGGRLLYNDGKMKSHAELLENADIEDAMRQPYPLEPERPDFTPDEEPGRIRCYPLLKALYGADQRSVERGIVRTLFGGKIKVRLAAPAAEAFQRIDTAWRLRPADPELNSYFSPIYGYFWRAIAKTNRLSPHSFGIAVDLNPDKGPYWQWSKLRPHPLQKTFPSAIVSLFEDNGFIWGGKWEHFDLMHFEYRPELIIKAKKLRAKANGEKPEDAS